MNNKQETSNKPIIEWVIEQLKELIRYDNESDGSKDTSIVIVERLYEITEQLKKELT